MSIKNNQINEEILARVLSAFHKLGVKEYGRNKKVSEIMGYSPPRISELLTGKQPFSKKFLTIFCSKFNISEQWITSGEGDMLAKPGIYDEPSQPEAKNRAESVHEKALEYQLLIKEVMKLTPDEALEYAAELRRRKNTK